ncbi:hypothetical protein V1478_002696 [Vespula squamosa]|uniref:Uncharacterized protein n=1 Tax=Vespula squamosa TaxID=30214 RepID=A0ABD2BTA8_VESSQ
MYVGTDRSRLFDKSTRRRCLLFTKEKEGIDIVESMREIANKDTRSCAYTYRQRFSIAIRSIDGG